MSQLIEEPPIHEVVRELVQQPKALKPVKRVIEEALLDVRRTRPILEQIGNKWSVLILTVLCTRPSRFNEIMRRLDGITHKALADALKRLERNGLIRRQVLTESTPIGVEYTITPLGHSLRQPFAALYDWAIAHGEELEHAQADYDAARL